MATIKLHGGPYDGGTLPWSLDQFGLPTVLTYTFEREKLAALGDDVTTYASSFNGSAFIFDYALEAVPTSEDLQRPDLTLDYRIGVRKRGFTPSPDEYEAVSTIRFSNGMEVTGSPNAPEMMALLAAASADRSQLMQFGIKDHVVNILDGLRYRGPKKSAS